MKKAVDRCHNCNQIFKNVKDRYYRFALEHNNSICPYRFDVAANTKKQLKFNLSQVLKQK